MIVSRYFRTNESSLFLTAGMMVCLSLNTHCRRGGRMRGEGREREGAVEGRGEKEREGRKGRKED